MEEKDRFLTRYELVRLTRSGNKGTREQSSMEEKNVAERRLIAASTYSVRIHASGFFVFASKWVNSM